MKRIILILIILICSGCTVQYDLKFVDEQIKEKIIVPVDLKDKKGVHNLKNKDYYAIYDGLGTKKYETTFEESDTQLFSNFKNDYSFSTFGRAYYINQCYDAVSFVKNDKEYILSTSKAFNCMSFDYMFIDDYKLNITTNHKVIENNADKIENGVYTWNINASNASNKPIYIKFGQVKNKFNFFSWLSNQNILYIFLSLLAITGVVIAAICYMLNKKNNII